jgi:TRAP-type C4-dicarboxylate transport system substrate-binding protein
MTKRDQELENELQEKGMQFTYPDKSLFEKAARPAYDALCGDLGPEAWEIVTQIRELR